MTSLEYSARYRWGIAPLVLSLLCGACESLHSDAACAEEVSWGSISGEAIRPCEFTGWDAQPVPVLAMAAPTEALSSPGASSDQVPLDEIIARLERLEKTYATPPALPSEPVVTPPNDPCTFGEPSPSCDCSKCAGYDKGFYVRTMDSNFMLKTNFMLQTRYIADWRDLDPGDGDPGEAGFVLERAPVIFSGNLISPELTYWVILQASPTTGTEFLEECRINYQFENGLFVQIGRFRDPSFMRELDVSYARIMGVERSYQHAIFSASIEEGICFSKQNDDLRVTAFFNDGRNSGSYAAGKDFFEDASSFAVSTGFDWKLAGDWTQYGDFASWPDEPFAAFIGADLHYEAPEAGDSIPANDLNEFVEWTVDATVERCGFMAFGSFVQRSSLVFGEDIHQTGVQALTAYQIIPEKLEPFARYEYIDFDGVTNVGAGRTAVADSSVNIISTGANWYFKRHAAKATIEVMHALDPIPVAIPATGFLADTSGNDGQTVLRTQLQILF